MKERAEKAVDLNVLNKQQRLDTVAAIRNLTEEG